MELSPFASPDFAKLLTLFARLVGQHGFTAITAENLRTFIDAPGEALLFFPDDPKRVPEAWDVAVVLPDIVQLNCPETRVGLIDPVLAKKLATEFGITMWPSLVFLRDGKYLGVIERMRDWDEYAERIATLRASEPSSPPSLQRAPLDNSPSLH